MSTMAEVPKPSLDGLTRDQMAYVADLERAFGTRTIGVTRNNRFPRWSFERYMLVGGFAASILIQAFYVGGKVENIDARLAAIEARERDYVRQSELMLRLELVREQIERATGAKPSMLPLPTFPRDERFGVDQ